MTEQENEFGVFDDLVDENQSQNSKENTESREIENQEMDADHLLFEYQTEKFREKLKKQTNLDKPQIIKKEFQQNCTLETIVNRNLKVEDFELLLNKIEKPAKEYPFQLDDFQKAAIQSVEKNISVLVAAHTSAGKTVVAEYVIAKCLKNNQRVIYTSPIKALSNQKYRDLKAEFGSVGLVTGDVTIDENQTCLVMTTEILRNMFFRSNEIAKETAWIIFDEAHYLKDKERGVIWEETIILAPKNVRYCLLSATAPNASELAQWIMKVKELDCINVVYTDFRPVPLEHFAFMSGDKRMLKIKDINGTLKEDNYQALNSKTIQDEEKQNKKQVGNAKDILNIVKLIYKKNFFPAIIFAFSKKEVENLAKSIQKNLKMLEQNEQSHLENLFKTMIGSLSAEDQQLPQIVSLLEILKAGVGLHHGGMLPILKEIVEILFQSGLIKILISTETFSMGVNMPAKCVVFSTIRKWDGEIFRQLQGSEFVQMSGRAGRRGKDSKGIVITMLDQNSDVTKFWKMMKSQSKNDPLISQFTISYNMLINTLLMEGMEPEQMVQKSFKQFQYEILSQKSGNLLDRWQKTLNFLKTEYFDINYEKFQSLLKIVQIQQKIEKEEEKINLILLEPVIILPYMNIGRLFFVEGCGWVPLINISKSQGKFYIDFFITLNYSKKKEQRKKIICNCYDCIKKFKYELMKEPKIITIPYEQIRKMSSIILVIPTNLLQIQEKMVLRETIQKVIQDVNHNVPLMSLIDDIPIEDQDLKKKTENCINLLDHLQNSFRMESINYNNQFLNSRKDLFIFEDTEQIEMLFREDFETTKVFFDEAPFDFLFQRKIISDPVITSEDIFHQELYSLRILYDFSKLIKTSLEKTEKTSLQVFNKKINTMKQILRRLEFISQDDVPNQKGKIASLIFGSDELCLTEILFSGLFRNLNPKQIDTILSMFVNEEKMKPGTAIQLKDEQLCEVILEIKKTLEYFSQVFQELELEDFDEEEMIQKLNTGMFKIIQMWYDGKSFLEISKNTQLFEGSIIRNIKRLYELLKQLIECAQQLGNKDLKEKLEEGSNKLYRGIAFTSSLYIQFN